MAGTRRELGCAGEVDFAVLLALLVGRLRKAKGEGRRHLKSKPTLSRRRDGVKREMSGIYQILGPMRRETTK